MVTETMVLIALRQKNWSSASALLDEMCTTDHKPIMKTICCALKHASTDPFAAYLISIWTEIRWNEICDDEFFS